MGAGAARLAALGVRADVLIPDYLAISKGPVSHDGFVLMKSASGGFAAEPDLAHLLLETPRGAVAPLSTARLLEDAYASLLAAVPVNLLQGRYAPRRDWAAAVRPWRRVGALAAGVVLAALVGLAAEGVRLNRAAEAATARAEASFRAALPEVKRVVNPRAQMRAYLQGANLTGSAGFLALSEVLVSAVSLVPDAEITTLRFDGKRAEIAATFSLPSFEAVEHIKREVTERGGLVQEGGARQDGSRILADMTVKQR
jgi:general secretion pathway protein L